MHAKLATEWTPNSLLSTAIGARLNARMHAAQLLDGFLVCVILLAP
jgi:hypothetical protein